MSEDDEARTEPEETGPRDFISDEARRTTAACCRRETRGRHVSATAQEIPAVVMPVSHAEIPSLDVPQQPGRAACEPVSPLTDNALTSSFTSHDFKPLAARLAQSRSRYRQQSQLSHGSREKFVGGDSSHVAQFGSKFDCSEYFTTLPLSFASVNMVRSHVSAPIASTSKRGSESDRDSDDRKRRPPSSKVSVDESSFRPRRCRKCKAEGKKGGRKYRSAKGLREHCVCHHSCTYHAVTDRYISLSTEECSRQVASIHANRRHRPTSDTYYASPPTRSTGRGVRRVEATPTTTSTTGKSTATTSVSSAKVSDSRCVVLHPSRFSAVYSSSSSDSSDDESPPGRPSSPLPDEFADCCAPAVPPSPARLEAPVLAAAVLPPLVEPVVSSATVTALPGESADTMVEPSASPFAGCLPVVAVKPLSTTGTIPPLSSSSGSDSDVSFDTMDVDFVGVDLDLETDGAIINAMDRHSDVVTPNSPASATWLQSVVATITSGDAEAARPPTPNESALPGVADTPPPTDAPVGQPVVVPPAAPDLTDPGDNEDIPPSGIVAQTVTSQTQDAASLTASPLCSVPGTGVTVPEPTTTTVTPTPVTLPDARATSSVGTAAAVASLETRAIPRLDDFDDVSDDFDDPVGLPNLRLTDLLEAASRISVDQVAAVARILARINNTTHSPEVIQDFLLLSVATRLRVIERLFERLTQYRLTGASNADIVVAIINFLQRIHAADSRH